MLAFAIAFPGVLPAVALVLEPAWVVSGGADLSLVAFGAIASGAVAVAAVRYRSSAAVPLVAETCGRVSYGSQVLLEVGANPRLYIEEQCRGPEGGTTFGVVASNRWGPVVRFPDPWFDEFEDRAVALWFARQLAAAIGAEVKDAAPGTLGETNT